MDDTFVELEDGELGTLEGKVVAVFCDGESTGCANLNRWCRKAARAVDASLLTVGWLDADNCATDVALYDADEFPTVLIIQEGVELERASGDEAYELLEEFFADLTDA